jgi:hypothetical protein
MFCNFRINEFCKRKEKRGIVDVYMEDQQLLVLF